MIRLTPAYRTITWAETAELVKLDGQRVAVFVHGFDPGEELCIHRGRAVVRGELRRDVALDGLQLRRRLRCGEIEEQPLDPVKAVAALVERRNRVVERRRVGVLGDGVDLGAMGVHRMEERGKVMLGFDLVERRQFVRCLPGLQQRIGGVGHLRRGTG